MSRFSGPWNESMSRALVVPKKYAVHLRALTVDEDNRAGVAVARKAIAEYAPAGLEEKWSADGLHHLGVIAHPVRTPAKGIVFYGPTGTGKSTIMGAMATELADKEVPYFWIYWTQLLDVLAGTFDTLDAKEAIARAAVLFIDELGEPEPGPKVGDRVRALFEERYSAELPFIAATNLDAAALQDRLGVAVASRMRETMDTVKVGPRDRRKRVEPAGRFV